MDRLKRTRFLGTINGHVFLTQHEAVSTLSSSVA